MKRIVLHFGFVILMMCLLFTACKKAEVITAADPQLTFALVPDNPIVSYATSQGGAVPSKQSFTWSAGTANITRFRLNAKRGGVASEYSSANLTNVDVFSINSLLSTISIPKGDYTEVKAAVVFSSVVAPPYPLVLQGTFTTAGGTSVPVEFDLNDNLEINVSIPNIIADGSKDFTANLAMHLNMLMNGIPPADIDAAARTNGSILISKTVNAAIYNKIKANMLGCSGASLANKPK